MCAVMMRERGSVLVGMSWSHNLDVLVEPSGQPLGLLVLPQGENVGAGESHTKSHQGLDGKAQPGKVRGKPGSNASWKSREENVSRRRRWMSNAAETLR